jgi:hypothetical protein
MAHLDVNVVDREFITSVFIMIIRGSGERTGQCDGCGYHFHGHFHCMISPLFVGSGSHC